MKLNHPLMPIYNEHSKILILGSFPSVKSRECGFYYGHPQNRFWKVLAALFNEPMPEAIEAKKEFLLHHKIALWDVVKSCEITGSDDNTISDVTANDLSVLLSDTQIKVIYCNGSTAYSLYNKYIYPVTRLKAIKLPSTSPANAGYSLTELISAYTRITVALKRKDYTSPYYSLSSYTEDYYEKKLYRLSLDGGFTCPNRDGLLGTKGCIFCDGGSGYFAGQNTDSITNQLEHQQLLIKDKLPKTKKCGYIAYFQSFTGTYAPINILKEKYYEAINNENIDILSIATRPDCLSSDVLELLSKINKTKPVWIELGLQTMHQKTADYIRRGYELKVYNQAVRNLHKAGISNIITHLIIGLPGETKSMILKSLMHVIECGSAGVKLQLLHVLKDTELANDYEKGLFDTLSLDEYLDILKDCIEILPPDMVTHRLTGDGSKARLIAPLWSCDKKTVINSITKTLQSCLATHGISD